jgi:predicted unusual protein kinase regulating ubiquinone biosynthesis (AarF/ABC1/UbiB family)
LKYNYNLNQIQHANIPIHCKGDISTVEWACSLVEKFFPEFKYAWLAQEFRINLPKEIDFIMEGENAEKIKKIFEKDERVIVRYRKKYIKNYNKINID